MAAILGLQDRAHADVPGRVWLFAFVDGQTRIDLQWSRNRNADPSVLDHKIEACNETADNDCHDADDTDWTTLVAAHPQETSTRHSNKYTHTGLSEGETWHYRIWSRNADGCVTADHRGEATATTASRTVAVDDTAATTTILKNGSVTVSIKAVKVEDDPNTPADEYEDKSIAEEGESA